MALFRGTLLLITFLATGAKCDELVDKEWWETAAVYQIWPRGFKDSNGDGEGDLKGIISQLDYVKELGVDAIWLNPIYTSPFVDSGFDISNYTDVNPLFGTLEHFDELVTAARNRSLKVILDIVPNHSSDKHEWFLRSAENDTQYSDYYMWANGSVDEKGNKKPPNNWVSTYDDEEGSAWTWHDRRQQWYYHKFHKSQPDLNLRNENVLQELKNVFDFWLKRNVDGFRINGVSYFNEDEDLRNEPEPGDGTNTSGLPKNVDLLYMFRSHIDKWVETNNATSKLLIAESYDSDKILVELYGNDTHKGIPPFNFRLITCLQNNSTAKDIINILENWFKILPNNASTNWVLSNHDNSRAATRIGLNRVDGLHMLSLLLPGQTYTYYGDEIAMLDREMLWNETIDPMGCSRSNKTYAKYSRDPERTPMQWNCATSAGFSTNATTYLPVNSDYRRRNVDAQREGNTNLNTYKLLIALRKEKVFTHGHYDFKSLNNDRVFILKRFLENHPTYIVAINLGLFEEKVNLTSLYLNLENSVTIVVASSNAVHANKDSVVPADSLLLSANAALVLRAEVKTEVTTESTTGSSTEPSTQSSTESTTGSSTEPSTQSSTESTTGSSTEPSTQSSTESTTGSSTEPSTQSSTEPSTQTSTESTTGSSTVMSTESSTQSTTEASTGSSTVISTESSTQYSTESSTEMSTKSSTQSGTESSTEISTENTTLAYNTSTTKKTTTPIETTTIPASTSRKPCPSSAVISMPILHSIISTIFAVILLSKF